MFGRMGIETGTGAIARTEEVDQESDSTAWAEIRLPLMAAKKKIVPETGPSLPGKVECN